MTTPVYPTLPGLSFPVVRSEIWSTVVQESWSGKETILPKWSFPRHKWSVAYDLLRQASAYQEWQTLIGFFNLVNGAGVPFLYQDLDDNGVTSQPFGTGDGTSKAFQLVRALGGFSEPMQSISGAPTIFVAGAQTTAFTLGPTGIVTFNTAPASGAALTWTGSYAFLCRFAEDAAEFSKFMSQLWEVKKLAWISLKQ